ncbi:hypothetical protein [Ureibacillus sp. FSL K6-2830]|uniref:hypothetical protein n=1 Tax=Ureibacillus sp. FSL K6-2830 TaxID=2954610 RepID=UPI0030F5CA8F
MNHEHWDEDRIEELLKNVPKIHDVRSKEEVFERLKRDGVFDEEPPKNSPIIKKKTKMMPWLIAACAALFAAVLIPSLTNNSMEEQAILNSEQDDSSGDQQEMETFALPNDMEEKENFAPMSTSDADIKTAVYPEQLEGNTLFKIGLASDEAESIPVTILIPNEKIVEDFGKDNPTQVELYNEYAPQLNEKLLGFNEYHPYVGEITESEGKVIHKLPNNHPYDEDAATYYATLTDTFSDYSEMEIVDENSEPVILEDIGEEYTLLTEKSKQHSYFKYVQNDGSEFLAPNFRETYSTVEEAMEALKVSTNDIYKSVILPNADYSVSVNHDVVIITFKNRLDLFEYNQVEAMQMIEAMLLTAAGFNKSVQFKNIVQTEWEGFDFTKPLPIPVGPNELPYTVLENR